MRSRQLQTVYFFDQAGKLIKHRTYKTRNLAWRAVLRARRAGKDARRFNGR